MEVNMINLLIADDEPLVQAGIKSMLVNGNYDINIVGTAMNGAVAYDMIIEYSPDIVITDIKMPVMSGLELAKKCYEEGRLLPIFIILTSYEEFQFVKEALTYQVVDYLIKLELTPEVLGTALTRAISIVTKHQASTSSSDSSLSSIYLLKEQFYTRLILNLLESEDHFKTQSQNLNLNFDYEAFAVSYVKLYSEKLNDMPAEKRLNLYTSSLQIARELTAKYVPCHVLSLDTKHFAIIFFLDKSIHNEYKSIINNTLEQVSTMLFNYYSVMIFASVGAVVKTPMQIASSFQDAKQIFTQINLEKPILFVEDTSYDKPLKNVFNMSLFKEDIRRAYAEFDEKALYDIFTSVVELFENHSTHYVQALDAAGNILYLSLSLLNNGEKIVSEIFKNRHNSYRSLYELTNVEQILEWLTIFRDGLCESFATHKKDYKNHIVMNMKKYITDHVEEKLTLNKVAEVFNISPNYLSVLFSKYNDVGFTDYINQSKIDAAKKIMASSDLKIYEISDILGFESAFYFSRVFKKVTGVAPRDFMNKIE
jgi:two-component system response regulator YesN